MNITVITPPPFEPVSVGQAYDHLRWDAEEEGSPPEPFFPLQGLIERNITSARMFVEQQTRRALVDQVIRLSDWGFPGAPNWWGFGGYAFGHSSAHIELLRPPLIEVLSFEYFDQANTLQTVAENGYFLTDDLVPRLMFVDGFSVPCTYRRPDAARVTYRVGYQPEGSPPTTQEEYAANVPAGLKDAILLGVQLLSDRFDKGEREDLERARDALMASFTIAKF